MVEAMRNALSPTSDHLAAPSDDPRLLSRLNRQTLKEPRLRRHQRMSIGCIALLCCAACSPHSAPDTSTSAAATTSATASAASASDDPYEKLPKVPSLSVSSQTLTDGAPLPRAQMSGIFGVPDGQDQSPQLEWTPGPEGTKSYVVTMYDIDAPTGSGFWHWAVHGLPASTTTLPAGAGDAGSTLLPSGAVQIPNDADMPQYVGAAPPKGDSPHRYYFTVTALDIEQLPESGTVTPEMLGFTISTHTLARGHLMATAAPA